MKLKNINCCIYPKVEVISETRDKSSYCNYTFTGKTCLRLLINEKYYNYPIFLSVGGNSLEDFFKELNFEVYKCQILPENLKLKLLHGLFLDENQENEFTRFEKEFNYKLNCLND